jgi:tRNA/tmRNA/rRNA uracil-C5-methylase (TrmA/RlmC/RlmD family)
MRIGLLLMDGLRAKSFEVGQRLSVSVEKVAHGGHFIARHEGQVIFIRHAIPGELVEVEITSTGSSFYRADVVKVIEASPDRVTPPCQYSHANGCGGCDFQHIDVARQRQLKADVIAEQFSRIAKRQVDVIVEEIGDPLGWRTRISSATDEKGQIGFYASRTHTVIPVKDCLIATSSINYAELATKRWPAKSRVEISASSGGERSIAIAPAIRGSNARLTQGPKVLNEIIHGHELQVSNASFWQSHELAPEILTSAVREHVRDGDHVLDLYGGVGLFAAAIIDLIGESGHVDLIESSPSATADARRNFENFSNVAIHTGEVEKVLEKIYRADIVILDPPREGAGKATLAKVVDFNPRTVVYVACDPAALARDCRYLEEMGWRMRPLRAFDLFPMTHHVECVAIFEPSQNQ